MRAGEAPTLSGTITISSVTTRDENRDAHLLAPDFFDAERYPEASPARTQRYRTRASASTSEAD